jgi:hypothetical protein
LPCLHLEQIMLTNDADGNGKSNTEFTINFINGEPAAAPGAAAMAVFIGGKYQVRIACKRPYHFLQVYYHGAVVQRPWQCAACSLAAVPTLHVPPHA